jgi:indolepyruvate ferredoxin oxidoreductase, alpha subunit
MTVATKKLLSGNEAIARGAWQAGVRLGAGYPGTPSTEILEALSGLPDVYCEWAPNEKVALEVAVGASLGGARALATMKHVGVNVAADPLFSVAYMGAHGGLVVVSADDPGMHSSQNEQDNRLLARAARIPLVEPSTPDEALRMTAAAFELSERFDAPVMLRTTTRLSHGKGSTEVGERTFPGTRPYRKNARKNVVLPAHGRARHRWIEEERTPGLAREAERWAEVREGTGEVAFITAGIPYLYVREAFPDSPVLKLGITYPLPEETIRRFAEGRGRIVVVEELEPFLEEQIRAMGIACEPRRWPRYGELSVDLLRTAVAPMDAHGPKVGNGSVNGARPALPVLPGRPPMLCPGCSHRGSFHALGRMRAIVSGDIGCYTLGALPPLDAMDACMNMGASIGMAHGLEKVLPEEERQRVVAVIGDSTFYHSGITGLVDVVYNGGASTVLILDNRTTAMTGHQDHPGTGQRLDEHPAPTVDLEALSRSLGVRDVRRLEAYDLLDAWRTLDDATKTPEPTVLLAEAPCVLKEKIRFGGAVAIDPATCTDCFACTRVGCPAIERVDGRLQVNALLCTGCTHCQQVCSNCNAGIDIPFVLELVDRGRMDEAVEVVLRANPLPAVVSRVCPHPCDTDVNALGWSQAKVFAERHPELLERFSETAGKISIRAVERFVGDHAIAHVPAGRFMPKEERAGTVAIVGSGPAGLSAAWYLRRGGWQVTVVEADAAPGGLLRNGIPPFRLPREVLDAELDRLREIGIAFRCGTRVGLDVQVNDLAEEFDAVIIAVGHGAARQMEIDGAAAVTQGVVPGLEFLKRFNEGNPMEAGRRVAIVGGGNTAIDCARASVRLGAEAVVVYRRTEEEMPAIPEEVEEARREKVSFRFQQLPVRVVAGPDGRLHTVETVEMRQGEPDASGRRRPVPVPGSELAEEFDTVVLAVGEESDIAFLAGSGIRSNGKVKVNFAGGTSRPGFFACGDVAFGHGTVSQAIATGRRTAELASDYLEKKGARG